MYVDTIIITFPNKFMSSIIKLSYLSYVDNSNYVKNLLEIYKKKLRIKHGVVTPNT